MRTSASFGHFFEFEYERLLRAMYLVTGDRNEAEDVTQDAFVKVLERWDRVEVMDEPVGYLYRTAMNTFRSRYRRTLTAIRRIALLETRPPNAFDEVELRDDVRRGISALTPRQRAAVVFTELLGYSAEDAALLLGIKSSTVRALTSQARSRMRAVLGDKDE